MTTSLSFADMWHLYLVDQLITDYPDAQNLSINDLEHRWYAKQCDLPYPPNLSVSDLKYASYISGIADPGAGLDLLTAEALLFADPRYYSGSGPLLNQGIAGSPLNLQLGTTAGADTNDPIFLAFAGEPYVYLEPTNAANRIQATFQVPGGNIDPDVFDFRIKVDISTRIAASSWLGIASNYASCWSIAAFANGSNTYDLAFFFWQAAARKDVYATTALPLSTRWIRVKRTKATGIVQFYTSDDGSTWTQLGTDVAAPVGSFDVGSGGLLFLGSDANNGFSFLGKIYEAQYYSGSNLVTSCRASDMTQTGTSDWAITRHTSGRKSALVISRPFFLFGADDIMTTPDNSLLDFPANAPFTALSFWVRHGVTTYYQAPFSKYASGPTQGYRGLFDNGNRKPLGQIDIAGTSNYFDTYVSGLGPPDHVLEVVGIGRLADNRVQGIGNDGRLIHGSLNIPQTLASTAAFEVGSLSFDMAQHVDGEFYGICVFPRELSPTEIKQVCAYYGVQLP